MRDVLRGLFFVGIGMLIEPAALLAIALEGKVIDMQPGQIALASVLLSMIAGASLIRFNGAIAARLVGQRRDETHRLTGDATDAAGQRVLIGGYGRVGHTIAVLLQASGVAFVAFDTDLKRVAIGRANGHPVHCGDIADRELLVVAHLHLGATALRILRVPADAVDLIIQGVRDCTREPVLDGAAESAEARRQWGLSLSGSVQARAPLGA